MEVCHFCFPFAANKPFYVYLYIYIYIYMCCRFKQKTEAKAIFLNPFTACSSCKRKFVVCPFVDKETNGSYLLANRLNRLAHLWMYGITSRDNVVLWIIRNINCSRQTGIILHCGQKNVSGSGYIPDNIMDITSSQNGKYFLANHMKYLGFMNKKVRQANCIRVT
jgi:hypothetical protein